MSKKVSKKETKKSKKDLPRFKAEGMKVSNVRVLSESTIAFSLLGGGLGLYNLKVIDGAKGRFIATPSHKGKDGNYYDDYAVYFDEKAANAIIKKVMAEVGDDEDEDDEDDEDEDDEDDEDDLPF